MIERNRANPILTPFTELEWANQKVYNCAVVQDENKDFQMIFRAMGDDRISRLGHAASKDGIHFEVNPKPFLVPEEKWESHGCEDPRMVKVGDTYMISYVGFDGRTPRQALTSTKDFISFGPRKLAFPSKSIGSRWGQKELRPKVIPGFDLESWKSEDANWSKAGALFPEKINGHQYMLVGDDGIYLAKLKNEIWEPEKNPIITNREGFFDAGYVENGPPPIKTQEGWLVFYHGVQTFFDSPGNMRNYRLGAIMLDLNEPENVLLRTNRPVLEAQEKYEKVGFIDIMEGMFEAHKNTNINELEKKADSGNLPMAVFCCGAVSTSKDTFNLYYSAADTVICLATTTLDSIKQLF